jgi:hypothetical protein
MRQNVKLRVVLADVFDSKAPSAMEQRIEYAFGANGQNFWERYFPCKKVHTNDRIVYLFSEYQLQLLYNWWARKYETGGVDVIQNLNISWQSFFSTPTLWKHGIFGYSDSYVCCIKRRADDDGFELLPVFFKAFLGIEKKNSANFFDGKFRGEKSGVKLTELPAIMPEIEKIFGGRRSNNAKWLGYPGSGISKKDRGPSLLFECCGAINTCTLQKNREINTE